MKMSVSGLVSSSGAMQVRTGPFRSLTVNRWPGLAGAADGANLRDCARVAGLGVLTPGEAGAGVEALVCVAAKAMKTARDRSAVCLCMSTCNFPERGSWWWAKECRM